MWALIGFVAFAFLAFFMNRGRDEVMRDSEARRDSMKADRLMAEVRKELADKAKQSPSRPDQDANQ